MLFPAAAVPAQATSSSPSFFRPPPPSPTLSSFCTGFFLNFCFHHVFAYDLFKGGSLIFAARFSFSPQRFYTLRYASSGKALQTPMVQTCHIFGAIYCAVWTCERNVAQLSVYLSHFNTDCFLLLLIKEETINSSTHGFLALKNKQFKN